MAKCIVRGAIVVVQSVERSKPNDPIAVLESEIGVRQRTALPNFLEYDRPPLPRCIAEQ